MAVACWFYVGYAGYGGWLLIARIFKVLLSSPVFVKTSGGDFCALCGLVPFRRTGRSPGLAICK
eukprot:9111801-Alexandrium_andersonii.AAC.1